MKSKEEIFKKFFGAHPGAFFGPSWPDISAAMEDYASQFQPTFGEWQLCPKCNGDGNLSRYNSPPMSTTATPLCDVCNGAKILARPITPPTQGNEFWTDQTVLEFAEQYRFSSSRISIQQFKEMRSPKKEIEL